MKSTKSRKTPPTYLNAVNRRTHTIKTLTEAYGDNAPPTVDIDMVTILRSLCTEGSQLACPEGHNHNEWIAPICDGVMGFFKQEGYLANKVTFQHPAKIAKAQMKQNAMAVAKAQAEKKVLADVVREVILELVGEGKLVIPTGAQTHRLDS